jgi:hypothetical protein
MGRAIPVRRPIAKPRISLGIDPSPGDRIEIRPGLGDVEILSRIVAADADDELVIGEPAAKARREAAMKWIRRKK